MPTSDHLVYSCSRYVQYEHDHRWKWTARMCGLAQRLIGLSPDRGPCWRCEGEQFEGHICGLCGRRS